MVTLTPNTIYWNALANDAVVDPETGYMTPGSEGASKESPCRFYPKSNKVFKNEDSTESIQVGKIRIPKNCEVPYVGAKVLVVDSVGGLVYEGLAKTRFDGQLTGGWIEV